MDPKPVPEEVMPLRKITKGRWLVMKMRLLAYIRVKMILQVSSIVRVSIKFILCAKLWSTTGSRLDQLH